MIRTHERMIVLSTTALLASLTGPAAAIDWVFTENYNSLTTAQLISLDGVANPIKGDTVFDTPVVPTTYEAQFDTFGVASVGVVNGALQLSRDFDTGTEAFTVLSTGQESNAPRNGMAVGGVQFRLDPATTTLGDSAGFHISFYRNLLHDGTQDQGPWSNNLAAVGFRNIGNGTFDVIGNGFRGPFGTPTGDLFGTIATGLQLGQWYTAEVYMPAFNAASAAEEVNAQFRILDETASTLLGHASIRSRHELRTVGSFSTELTPEVVGIQTINTQSMNATWDVDNVQIGKGTASDIDAIFANFTPSAGSYHDYDFDGNVDANDVAFYLTDYLLTDFGDVDLNGSIDAADLAIALSNLNTAGGWADGDVTGDGQITAADIAIIQAAIGGPLALAGDYNNSGSVEQGDLDLVLNNWGGPRTAGFVANADGFSTANVDQEELDRVLNNWGSSNGPALTGVSVPEPASLAMLVVGGLALLRRRA